MNSFETTEIKPFAYSKSQIWYAQVLGNEEQLAKDPHTFSYDALVTDWDECQRSFTFPQKCTLKRFNKLSDMFYFDQLLNSDDQAKEKNKSKIWYVLMIWLTYGTKYDHISHEKLNTTRFRHSYQNLIFSVAFFQLSSLRPHVANTLDFFIGYFIDLEEECNEKYNDVKKLYEQHLIHKPNELFLDEFIFREQISEDFDRLRDFLFFTNHENELINLLSITTKTTFKSMNAKIKKWHEDVILQSLKDLNSSDNEEYPHLLLKTHQINSSTITPLCDSHSIKREGIEMNHCVSSFENDVKNNKYIVFTIERFAERATLGVDLSFNDTSIPSFSFSQCYKRLNKTVSEELLFDALEFIKKINLTPEIIISFNLLNVDVDN